MEIYFESEINDDGSFEIYKTSSDADGEIRTRILVLKCASFFEYLQVLIKKLEKKLEGVRDFMNNESHSHDDDDDWENTRELWEMSEDKLTDQIRCLSSFECYPSTYVGDDKAKVIAELILQLKADSEQESHEINADITILEEILAIR